MPGDGEENVRALVGLLSNMGGAGKVEVQVSVHELEKNGRAVL